MTSLKESVARQLQLDISGCEVLYLFPKISVIIPCHNEEKPIIQTLKDYHSFLSKNFRGFELIAVANNCSDRTPQLISDFVRSHNGTIAVNLPYYTGKGGAVAHGFAISKGPIVCFVDADNSAKPKELPKLLARLKEGYDVAIGSRAVLDSKIGIPQPFVRRLLGMFFSVYTSLLFGLGVRDTQCGAKAFSRKVVHLFLKEQIVKGFEFDVQLLWIAKRNGLRIAEQGIEWSDNIDSKVRLLDPLWMFASLLRLRLGL